MNRQDVLHSWKIDQFFDAAPFHAPTPGAGKTMEKEPSRSTTCSDSDQWILRQMAKAPSSMNQSQNILCQWIPPLLTQIWMGKNPCKTSFVPGEVLVSMSGTGSTG